MTILRVQTGTDKGKKYSIESDSLVLGRDSDCEVQVLDQGVSRRHSEIFRIGEMFFIRDLESRNHTYVNEKDVSEEILRIGDHIRIGNTVLVFEDRIAQLRDSSRIVPPEIEADLAAVVDPTSTITLRATKVFPTKNPEDDKATREARNLNVLLHLSQTIAEEKNLSKLFQKVSELLGKSIGADHLYLLGISSTSKNGTTNDAIGVGKNTHFDILGRFDKDDDPDKAVGVSRGIIKECLTHNRSVLTSDASLDQHFNAMASVVMNQIRSVICVPISVLGKNLGVIYIYANRAEAFDGDDLEISSAIGIQLGSTFELLKMITRQDTFFRSSIRTLVNAAEMRTPTPRGISERVASYCLAITKELGRSTQRVRDAWLAGMLHDIGSIPMTDQELQNRITSETKRNHYAREILSDIPGLEHLRPAIEQQNERWDGSGSPEGKAGADIDELARVVGIAKELDAQLYGTENSDVLGGGGETSVKEALLKIKEMADRQFDRQTVNALLIAYRNGTLFNPDQAFFEVPAV